MRDGVINIKSFEDLNVGNVAIVYDEYSHDYILHRVLIESAEKEMGYITDTNPFGLVYYGTDLDEELWGDEYITVVTEGNFQSIAYPHIASLHNGITLYKTLSHEALEIIEDVLVATIESKIDIKLPSSTEQTGEPEDGEFHLIIYDNSYKENGCELLVLKWLEDCEDTEYLIEIMQELYPKEVL